MLYNAVLSDIQRYAVLAAEDEDNLVEKILKINDEFNNKNISRYEKNIRESKNKNRIREIDGLLQSLFEEKISGNVGEISFKRMTRKYEEEHCKKLYSKGN